MSAPRTPANATPLSARQGEPKARRAPSADARVPRGSGRGRANRLHRQRVHPPSLSPLLWEEANGLIALADTVSSAAVVGRSRISLSDDLLLGRSLKARCKAVVADPAIAGPAMVLRLLGERLHAVGGHDLLEFAVDHLAGDLVNHADLRRELLRQSWHAVGEFLA